MGRITVFTLDGCAYCQRVKSAFARRNIPYVEISLTVYPHRRNDMLSLADQLTVPQVFFNETHVGGADETIQLLEDWDVDEFYYGDYGSALSRKHDHSEEGHFARMRYRREVKRQDDPVDRRLAVPITAESVPRMQIDSAAHLPPPRNAKEGSVELLDGSQKLVSVVAITTFLVKFMPKSDLPYRSRVYHNAFTGKDGVTALRRKFKLRSREEAVKLGRSLQRKQILDHVCKEHPFEDTDRFFYRLQPYQRPKVLNSFRVWTERVDPDGMGVLLRLISMLDRVLDHATDTCSDRIDYEAAGRDLNFFVFEEASCELQGIHLAKMDESTRLAFSINLYNLMIRHAFVKVGIATNARQRSAFFQLVCYDVGGEELSCDELEHGIIRANRRPPYTFSPPFGPLDDRRRLSLSRCDARIHFALNCGSKSCPPLKTFTAEALDEELRIVTLAYCEDNENVSIDEENHMMTLSTLFYWYRSDFCKSSSKLSSFLVEYLRGEKRESLRRMIDTGKKKIEIKYRAYDWTSNALESVIFESSRLDANEVSVRAFFSDTKSFYAKE